jgi:hypothetical protein
MRSTLPALKRAIEPEKPTQVDFYLSRQVGPALPDSAT